MQSEEFFVVFPSWPTILNMCTCPYESLLIRMFIVGAIATRSFSRPRNKKIKRHYTSLQYWWRYMRHCYNI